MENHQTINGKTHYFDWAIFNSWLGSLSIQRARDLPFLAAMIHPSVMSCFQTMVIDGAEIPKKRPIYIYIYQYHPISYFLITIFQAVFATRKSRGPTIARKLAIATSLKHVLSALYDIHIYAAYTSSWGLLIPCPIPSGNMLHSYGNWPIEIVDLPMNSMVIFHSYLMLS